VTNSQKFYIGGTWVEPLSSETREVINPATEQSVATVAMGMVGDAVRAIEAASTAFVSFSNTSRTERLDLLTSIIDVYQTRVDDLAEAVTVEMGAPVGLSRNDQVPAGLNQFIQARTALDSFKFEDRDGRTALVYEPAGVCGLITPWNWPLLLIASKVAPALAAGCSMVLKPSELAPGNALILAEILHEAGVPAGVFNLVNGDGPTVGSTLSSHPDVDLVSITGSTRAGIEVARNAAGTVKRVHQELGGKSANILLSDVDFDVVVPRDVVAMVENSGQSCNAASRILVPSDRLKEVESIAANAANAVVVGAPENPLTNIGPVASRQQFEKVQRMIVEAIEQGATVVAGGPGRPDGFERGYYVRPTVISNVTNDMLIAREEIFGPVMTLIPYGNDEDAVRIANDTVYGLSGMVSSSDLNRARDVARRIRAGMVHVNGKGLDGKSPFGGYKQSGNGREYGDFGLREFLEVKAIFGYYE
jgi:aldehyde dehydrogenase (NAD+)